VAVTELDQPTISRLVCFSLTTADANGLAAFYESAFGCQTLATERLSGPDFESLMGVRGGARRVSLSLGQEVIELLQFDQAGRPYPKGASASDLVFQHFAIVVKDMAQAHQRLLTVEGSSPISRAGPQRLPQSSGGVTAFKFRDPEGHPLEFLSFPKDNVPTIWRKVSGGTCLGVDHSAISVSDTARSIAFYENLGFEVAARTLNQGSEQEMLDNLSGVRVEVTALKPRRATPHLELLCYRATPQDRVTSRSNADVATARLVLQARGALDSKGGYTFQRNAVDPDGHRVLLVPAVGQFCA
jgi:catechol 2,3-dioxygenase-like lactoylglutathione lyase family enzyme